MQSFPSIEVTILPTERTRRNSWKLGSLMSLMCPPIFWILQSPCRVFQEVREVWQWLVDFAMDSKSESWLPSAQAATRHSQERMDFAPVGFLNWTNEWLLTTGYYWSYVRNPSKSNIWVICRMKSVGMFRTCLECSTLQVNVTRIVPVNPAPSSILRR